MLEATNPLGKVLLDGLNSLDTSNVSRVPYWATDHVLVESKHGHLGAVLEEIEGSCQHLCRTPNHGTDVAVP